MILMDYLSRFFAAILNRSLGACALILVVILLRLILRKTPKWAICLLWAMVAFRLMCPVSLTSPISVYQLEPSTISTTGNLYHFTYTETPEKPEIEVNIPALPGYPDNQPTPVEGLPIHTTQIYAPDAMMFYFVGVAAIVWYAVMSYLNLRRRTRASLQLQDNVYLCDSIQTPFLLGLIKPKIYLPSSLGEAEMPYVIAHEQAHQQRLDHCWKALGFALLTVHWFNPLCWLSYALFCRDLELACDENACKAMDVDTRKAYANALLACATGRSGLSMGALAFGEVGVKTRVKRLRRYRRPAKIIAAICLVLCAVLGAAFLTNPPALHYNSSLVMSEGIVYDDRRPQEEPDSLTQEQLEEVADRLTHLSGSLRSRSYDGLTPMYQLAITFEGGGMMYINGYSEDGEVVGVSYRGYHYVITDKSFCHYISWLCSENPHTDYNYPETPSIQYSADSSMEGPQISYQPFDNIMGYTGFVEHHLQPMTDGVQLGTVPHWEERYYYGWTDNGVKILGYAFGWAESQSDDFSVDLNSDGQEELVCSCVYGGDGAQRVQVYSLDESGQLHAWRMNSDKFLNEEWVWGVNASAEYYDGTRFCLDFFPIDQSGDAPVELPEEHYHPIWPEDFVEMDLYDAIGEQFRGQD